MLPQNPSQIYKAGLRFHDEDETYRCLSVFNFGAYFDESRRPFGNLEIVNDETLAPRQTQSFSIAKNKNLILIPLVGTIDYHDGIGNQNDIGTEEIQVLKTTKPIAFQLRNPYETELINYLQIRISSVSEKDFFEKKQFDFNRRNELFPLLESEGHKISIGIFSGRSEGFYRLPKENGAFAFVINGAFEFQNRLLESRDALVIWDVSEIEFEALSENAILLLIETLL
ncbi:MAG: hypothetical protein QM710_07315 [Flavobacterium sp.]